MRLNLSTLTVRRASDVLADFDQHPYDGLIGPSMKWSTIQQLAMAFRVVIQR